MKGLWIFLASLGIVMIQVGEAFPQVNVGRFQLVSVAVGQETGVFLIDTTTGCTWQLASSPDSKRLTFVEMDVENLHWSWGSGAQQKLGQKIDESTLTIDQKRTLKQELGKTACGWTPVVLTPGASPPAKPQNAPLGKQ